jgi:hypothetical protein
MLLSLLLALLPCLNQHLMRFGQVLSMLDQGNLFFVYNLYFLCDFDLPFTLLGGKRLKAIPQLFKRRLIVSYHLFIIIFQGCPFTSKSLDFLAVLYKNASNEFISLCG